MKNFLLIIVTVFIIISCNTNSKKITDSENENVIRVQDDDALMNKAIETAVLKLSEFDTAFKSGIYDTSTFAIKVRFDAPGGGEHMWATYLTYKNGSYYGTVDDTPVSTTDVKEGERIKISKSNVSDWMYADTNGVLKGGFTIRVLRNKMNTEEKAAFDSSFSLIIKD